ncbi:MAG: hypothetical protein J5U17_06915, partial [Candidatus Methanoperedens sp.]|nr:hypothetical protein [Candidatus Methanoperedens sp.]
MMREETIEWIEWLFREESDPDNNARFHVDTNGSILTPDYLDELVEAVMTDIGIDLKSLELDTFSHITEVNNRRDWE